MAEILGIDRTMWICNLGEWVSYIVQILIARFFHNNPEYWDPEADRLLCRAGLIDEEGDITEEGRKRAFGMFAQIADIFDTHPVDPEEFYRKWSSPTL